MGPKPGTSANSCVQQPVRFKNDIWTCDFIHDRTVSGRPLKWLTLVDEYILGPVRSGTNWRQLGTGINC